MNRYKYNCNLMSIIIYEQLYRIVLKHLKNNGYLRNMLKMKQSP